MEKYNYIIILLIMIFLNVWIAKAYPKFRGFMGEFWVKLELKKLSKKDYKILNDIMVIDGTNTYQIDHIVLSKYGIFVIEMKNYYGLIYGNEYKKSWMQILGKTKNYFYNPIHQNYGHIKALSNILDLPESYFISIICFSNQSKLKITSKQPVIYLDNITNTIKLYKEEKLNNDINIVYEKLLRLNITDKKIRKEHVSIIKDKIRSKDKYN